MPPMAGMPPVQPISSGAPTSDISSVASQPRPLFPAAASSQVPVCQHRLNKLLMFSYKKNFSVIACFSLSLICLVSITLKMFVFL